MKRAAFNDRLDNDGDLFRSAYTIRWKDIPLFGTYDTRPRSSRVDTIDTDSILTV